MSTRKPMRLENYDYSTAGAYFVTICVKDRKPILSDIVEQGRQYCAFVKNANHKRNRQTNFSALLL